MKLSIIFTIIVISFQLGCKQNSAIGEKPKPSLKEEIKILSDLSVSKARLPDEAIVEQNTKVIEMADDKRETILKQPIPSFAFVFSCEVDSRKVCEEETVKVELPQDGIDLVENYWKKTIEIRYLEAAEKNLNYEQMLNLLTSHGEAGMKFEGELNEVKIGAPNGTRNISFFEADQINRLIISFADKVVDTALKKKNGENQSSV